MKTFKVLPRLFAVFSFVMMLGVTNAHSADVCYDPPTTTGFLCLGFFDVGCTTTTPIRNISSSTLTNTTIIHAFQGFSFDFGNSIGIDTVNKTVNKDADSAEYDGTLNDYTGFNGFVDFSIFGKGIVYRTGDYAPSSSTSTADQHTIFVKNTISMGFEAEKYLAAYTKDSVVYNTRIYPCNTKLVTLSPSKSIIEGNTSTVTPADFTVTLSIKPTVADMYVNYTITAGTATPGTDYSATSYSGSLKFNKNTPTLTQTIPVSVVGDLDLEGNETFTVAITSLTQNSSENFIIDESFQNGVVTIIDDDVSPPQVGWEQAAYETAEDTTLAYGGISQMPMRIVLDAAVDYPISVTYQTYNGTAIGDVDYRIAGGTVTIPAGQTSVTVNMDIYHDEAIELAENFTVVLSNPTGSGGVSLRTDRTTAPVTITEQNTAPVCYSDNFNTASLDTTWRTLYSSGGFTPATVDNRLRMTTATGNLATAVTKDYEFPSSENIIIVEFTHYAYSGSGADGLAMVLYDSAVGASPTPGAFGGSLGYAQKSNPGSDCTVIGGCPGFQGGWLGLGIDEYGNYQNPTEGRIGGTAFTSNAISIRGDGSGVSGYEYLAGTTSQTPALWNSGGTALPGDKFRMTVDSRDTAHLYIRLERDTGSGYQTIINQFDAKNIAYAQSTTPAFIRLALTASTGGSNAIHEIDDITVWGRCTPYTPVPVTPPANMGAVDVVDNYLTNGYTSQKGLATKITSKPGNSLDAVWLGTAAGSTTLTTYYTAGNNNVLDMPVLFYVSDINSTNDNGMCTTERYQLMGVNGTPLVSTFHAGDIYARTTSTFTVQNSAKKYSKIVPKYINFYGMNLLDPTITCLINSSNNGNIVGMPQCVNSENQYLAAFGQTAVDQCRGTINGAPCEPNNHGIGTGIYNHEYGCYQCTIDALATKGCSSDAFAIRPDRFVVTSTNAAMPNLLRAGQEYNNTINAYNYNTTTNTLDYNVTSAMSVFNLVTTKYNRNDVVTASMAGTATLPTNDLNISNGLSSGVGGTEVAGLIFGDVGKINLSLQDRIWSAVDNDDVPSALNCEGAYICSDKNVTFIPDHFDFNELNITNNNGNPGSFTYIANEFTQMGGRIHTQMRALNKSGSVTQNFDATPLWENNVSVTPVVAVAPATYLYPDANETMITSLALGFGTGSDVNGTKTIVWNESNTSKYLRFNFQRNVNQTANPFNVTGNDINISMTSHYIDPDNIVKTADINGSRLGTVSPAEGGSRFLYGRIIPRDVRVFGAVPFTANAWYEVFNTTAIGTTALPISRNDAAWSTNTLHSDANDGDGNVTVVITGANPANAAAVNGVETYTFGAGSLGGYKAHILTKPWLWYGTTALPYLDPANAANLDCLTHPCFNINVVPAVGATGSAKSTNTATKASKRSTEGGGAWKSTKDYAPAIR